MTTTFDDSWLNSATRQDKERLLRSLLEMKETRAISKLSRHVANPGFQKKFIQSQKKIRLITVGNQSGKALRSCTKVMTPEGWKEIQHLSINDTVYDENGNPTKVTGVFPQGKKKLYRVTFDDGVHIDADAEHLWKILPRKWQASNESVVTTQWIYDRYTTLSTAPKNRVQIPIVKGISLPHVDTLIDPYAMGLLLGDGGMTQNGVRFSTKDPEQIEYLGRWATLVQRSEYDWRIIRSDIPKHLREYGLIGKKSHEKFVPEEYLLNDDETRLSILQGLMDTDGYQGTWTAEYSTTSKNLADSVMYLLQSFGQKVSCVEVHNTYTHKGEKRLGRLSYRLQIRTPTIQLFRLKRKQQGNVSARTPNRIIHSVEMVDVDNAVCIAVDSPTRTFVCENFVVTHNTHICAYEAACYALGCHPHKKIRIPNTGWIVTSKPLKDGVEKDILPKILELVGSEDIRAIKNNSQGIPHKIVWRTGSVSYILSAEQDDMVFEGTTLDWAWFDEPFRREIYIAVLRGLMKAGGHLWWSMTPLDHPWIYDEIYQPGISGHNDIEVFEGSPDENKFVSKEERDTFRSTLTADEIETRIYGKFRHLSGRVFKTYNPEVHRVPSFDIPLHWPVWEAVDPHTGKPHAALWLAVSPHGAYYICNEIFYRCTVSDLRELILDLENQYHMVERLIDTSAQEDHWEHQSARELLKPLRFKLAQKKGKKRSGILLINQLFQNNQLFVMEHCTRVHKELMLQVYKKIKGQDGRVTDEPQKKYDDMTDCLRYILVERPDLSGPAQIKTREAPYKQVTQ